MTSPSNFNSDRRQDNFAAIRLIAAILVLYGHSFPLTGGIGPSYLGNAVSTISVKVFFVISGYLISESWIRDPHLPRFLMRRALRIFPALIVLCFFTVFFVGPALGTLTPGAYFSTSGTWRYFENIVLLPRYDLPGLFADNVYPNAVNGSLWTLPVEFSMYLLTPVVLLLPSSRHHVWVAAIALSVASVWFARWNIPEHPTVFWGTNLVNAVEMAPYFVWGMVFRLWFRPKHFNLQIALAMMLLLPLLATDWPRSEIISLIVIPYCTLAIGHATPPRFAWAEKFGDFSYGTYLYGFLFQQIVANYLANSGNHWANFLFALVPTLIFGLASWKLIEQPALKIKPKTPKTKSNLSATGPANEAITG